jgi:hypothetical protein
MILSETLAKLDELRRLWKEYPEKRIIYELKARPLKSALHIYYRDHPQQKLDNTD